MLGTVALAVAGAASEEEEPPAGAEPAAQPTLTQPEAAAVDTAQVEQEIKEDFSSGTVTVTNVDCPANPDVEVGGKFTCSFFLSNDGGGKVEVTRGAAAYTYVAVPGSVTVPGTSVAQQVEQALEDEGVPDATVTCPDTIVVKTDSTVTCEVGSASGALTGDVTFSFTSETGEVDSSSVDTG